jgi:acetyltransferase-like isoleucine patch superfamily enzyme
MPMRKITLPQIGLFIPLFSMILALGICTAWLTVGQANLGDFRGIGTVAAAIVLIYLYALIVYRIFLGFMPLQEGELREGTREEFAAQVNTLFYLLLFYSLIRTHFVPVPIMRLVYLALGAKLGDNTYSGGALLDPPLTELGANCIIGHDAVLFCHAIEGTRFSLSRIRVGNNVTIGAGAIIMSGVRIQDGAIVSAGSVVLKGTRIGKDEVWGGVPAKRLRSGNVIAS